MAKIVFSAVVGDARGKTGGTVFTKGRHGAFIRRKVSPIQPRTSAQSGVRANFTKLSKAWSGASMTDVLRAAWDALAALYPQKDKFGASHVLTGLQMFLKLNRALSNFDMGPIYTPPATLAAGAPGSLSVTATAPSTLTISPTVNPLGSEGTEIFAAAQQSPGRTFVGSRYRLIGATLTAPPWNFAAQYTAKFGNLIALKKVPIKVVYMTQATGAQGTPTTALQVVS